MKSLSKKYNFSQLSIASRILGWKAQVGEGFNAPYRNSNSKGVFLFWGDRYTEDADLLYYDFPRGETGNLCTLYKKVYNYRYQANISNSLALKYLHAMLDSSTEEDMLDVPDQPSSQTVIKPFIVPHDSYSKDYWGKWGLNPETLSQFEVQRTKGFMYLNQNGLKSIKLQGFAWGAEDKWKILNPGKSIKWFSNLGKIPEGLKHLRGGGNLVITKAYKEVMFLRQFGGGDSVGLPEGFTLSEKYLKELRPKYNKILTLLDNDETGQKTSQQYRAMGLETKFIYNAKNITDAYEINPTYARDYAEKLFHFQ